MPYDVSAMLLRYHATSTFLTRLLYHAHASIAPYEVSPRLLRYPHINCCITLRSRAAANFTVAPYGVSPRLLRLGGEAVSVTVA
eukprot:3275652-Rhodomonas_salina.1